MTRSTAAEKLSTQGTNNINTIANQSAPIAWILFQKFVRSFVSGFAPLLWVATVLSFLGWHLLSPRSAKFLAHDLVIAIILLILICSASMLTFFQDLQAIRNVESAEALFPKFCQVIRESKRCNIPVVTPKIALHCFSSLLQVMDLVVGDIVELWTSCGVPADLRVAVSHGLKSDRSLLTGNSEPLRSVR